jgi:hypothetical protein
MRRRMRSRPEGDSRTAADRALETHPGCFGRWGLRALATSVLRAEDDVTGVPNRMTRCYRGASDLGAPGASACARRSM